ncbi:MAG: hypothetical protein M3364_00300, partial [Actinomycetota bacterium]|nr:hypothetical protein [Actinomycetota bacterium]
MSTGTIVVSGAVEGIVDQAVLRRLLGHVGLPAGPIHVTGGKQKLLQSLDGYNRAAVHAPWVVLVDLDQDADCAPPFISSVMTAPAVGMNLRIAVRQVESWLLADRAHLASFLRIPRAIVPRNLEAEPDPKQTMVDLARRSRDRGVRDEMVPRPGAGRRAGPGYAGRLIDFVDNRWDPNTAA